LAGAAILRRFPPAENSFYPRCLFYATFHLQCPGCGATRALASLLRGQFLEAMHWNAAFVLLLPFMAIFLGSTYYRALRPQPFVWPAVPASWLTIGLTAVIFFTIARDLYSF